MIDLKHVVLIYIFVLTFVLVFYALAKYNATIHDSAVAKILLIDNRLLLEKKNFNYAEIKSRLYSHGFGEKFEKPTYYFLIKIMCGAIGAIAVCLLHPALILLGFVIGFFGFNYYEAHKNKRDNEDMQADITMLYNVLSTQLRSGVYPQDALIECISLMRNKRLIRTFREFEKNALNGVLTFEENLDFLESRFDNDNISALCMTLKQNEESGRSQDLIRDLIKQMNDMEEIRFQHAKAKMDRMLTFFMIFLFSDIMIYILYIFIINIMELV